MSTWGDDYDDEPGIEAEPIEVDEDEVDAIADQLQADAAAADKEEPPRLVYGSVDEFVREHLGSCETVPMSTDQSPPGPLTRVHLVRHGLVHNPDGVLYGRIAGFRLAEAGEQMAEPVTEYFAGRGGGAQERSDVAVPTLTFEGATLQGVAYCEPARDLLSTGPVVAGA